MIELSDSCMNLLTEFNSPGSGGRCCNGRNPIDCKELFFEVSKTDSYVPIIIVSQFYRGLDFSEYDKIVFSNIVEGACIGTNGATAILRKFSRQWTRGLLKIVTNKNEVYYGNRGIILDSRYNPLLVVLKDYISTDANKKVIISPSVFLNPGTLNNYIISKGVPFFLIDSPTTKVEITDPSQYITSIKEVHIADTTNEALNDLLIEHMEEILDCNDLRDRSRQLD